MDNNAILRTINIYRDATRKRHHNKYVEDKLVFVVIASVCFSEASTHWSVELRERSTSTVGREDLVHGECVVQVSVLHHPVDIFGICLGSNEVFEREVKVKTRKSKFKRGLEGYNKREMQR